MRLHQLAELGDLGLATDEAGRLNWKVARDDVDRLQRRKLGSQASGPDLKDVERLRQVTQPAQPEIDQVDSVEEFNGRRRNQDLPSVAGRHQPRRPVQRHIEVIGAVRLDLTGRNAHPHRQRQPQLRVDRRVHGLTGGCERRTHPVARVLEHSTLVALDHRSQHRVVVRKGDAHGIGIGLPAMR